ncbi:MAG: hypothetical protein G01um101429_1007 [Parcubacteria group bacterium Gr01-1014_29]|nr:MAG: hypothetical protein G01um101429_1007 [Parcubacteria group bacterium Gr01-1014_29]
MSYADDLLIYLTSYHKGYKLMRARMGGYGGPPEALFGEKRKKIKNSTFRVTLFRLEKQGMIECDDLLWRITEKGKEYLARKLAKRLPSHSKRSEVKVVKQKNIIIIFDVPEKLHRKRDWLREELTQLGFTMLQKSVWFGPSPLPKSFIRNVQHMNLLCCLKFFRADEAEIV